MVSVLNVYTEGKEPRGKIIINQTAKAFTPGFAWWVLYLPDDYIKCRDNHTMKCIEKRSINSFSVTDSRNIELRPHDYVKPHTWIVVLLNCPVGSNQTSELLDIDYTVHFINQDEGELPAICDDNQSSSSSITQISLTITLAGILSSLLSLRY